LSAKEVPPHKKIKPAEWLAWLLSIPCDLTRMANAFCDCVNLHLLDESVKQKVT
jgi:hypothetical protein